MPRTNLKDEQINRQNRPDGSKYPGQHQISQYNHKYNSSPGIMPRTNVKDKQIKSQNRPDGSKYPGQHQISHYTQKPIPTSQKTTTKTPTTQTPTTKTPRTDYSKYTPLLLLLAAMPVIIFAITKNNIR